MLQNAYFICSVTPAVAIHNRQNILHTYSIEITQHKNMKYFYLHVFANQ